MAITGVIFLSSNIKPRQITEDKPQPPKQKPFLEKLTRNVAVATAVLLGVVALRGTAANGGNFVQAVKDIVESEWDQNVGRLTYVSSTLADSIQVFGGAQQEWICPVVGAAALTVSALSSGLRYEKAGAVYAAAAGEVTQIAHDDDERYIVRVFHQDGISTIYYGLDSCAVREGDPVEADTVLGVSSNAFAFEAQKYGKSIDISAKLRERTK